MFSSIKHYFEKFSFTDEEDSKDRRPIAIKRPISYCFDRLESSLKSKNCKDFVSRKDYYELYYVDPKGNEITILLLESKAGETLISCHVASPSINMSNKKLIETMKGIKELFGCSSNE